MHDSSGQVYRLLAWHGKVGVVASVGPQCSFLLHLFTAGTKRLVEYNIMVALLQKLVHKTSLSHNLVRKPSVRAKSGLCDFRGKSRQ